MDAKYEKNDIKEIIKEHCSHLYKAQQGQLKDTLLKYDKLFDGVLKEYPGQPIHIDLQPNASPVHRRRYSVPEVHLATFKKELDHLVEIGVLFPVRNTEWGLPTFITPKKMAE